MSPRRARSANSRRAPGPYITSIALRDQSDEHMLGDAFAMLDLGGFHDFCNTVNEDAERGSLSSLGTQDAWTKNNAPELRVVFEQLASIVCECENEARISPRRGEVRPILENTAERLDRIASMLEDNGMRSEPMASSIRMPDEMERKLRLAVDRWYHRTLEGNTDSGKVQVHAKEMLQDVEFLIGIGAFVPPPMIHDRSIIDAKALPPSLRNSAETEAARILQEIRARWVPDPTIVLSSCGMCALSEGIRRRVEVQLPPHRGSRKLSVALGSLTGRELCAVATIDLFGFFRGWKPAHDNPEAQRLCAILWRMAGLGMLRGQQRDENSDGGWDAPLRFKWAEGRGDALLDGHLIVAQVLQRNGFVRNPSC